MKKLIYFLSLLVFSFLNSIAQITTSVNPTIAQLQSALQGNGVVVTGVTLTCPNNAYALFGNGAGVFGGTTLNSGILLTTGTATNVAGPAVNTTGADLSYDSGAPGSALGNSLAGGTTYDGCSINFLITPSCTTLSISYVFASEEYPEFVGGSYNDVFGFMITGPNPLGPAYNNSNLAMIPGTSTPVSINNVNANTNSSYYVSAPPNILYDGMTTILTASAAVTPCQVYTMTIGVWDDGDGAFDSGVFLDVNGLSCLNSPTITATASPTTICAGQTVTLTAGGGIPSGTYTWAAPPTGGLASNSGTIVTANPTSTTTYSLMYSDMNSCPGTYVTELVTVNITGSTTAITPSLSSICVGQSQVLTASGSGPYAWTASSGPNPPAAASVTVSPTSTTTYTVLTGTGSCTSTAVATVSVTTSPSISITPSLSTICAGQSQVLTSSGSGPFTWTASSGANPPAVATVTVSPSSTTTYTVLSGTGTCTSTAVATVSISTTPSISITPSLSTICSGQSQVLTSSGSGPFTWTASSGANPPAAATVTVSPSSTTTYTVLSGTGTCTAQAVATVSVSANPSINITPSNTTICVGENVTLTSTGSGPFTWTASSGANPPSAATVTVSPSVTTTYTVLSGTGTCTSTAVATVSISPVGTISITPPSTIICSGKTTTLTVNGSTGPFSWTANTGTNPVNLGTVTVAPFTTTTYTVIAGTGACTTQAVVTVSVSLPISVTATPASTSICNGSSTTISASGATSYTWAPGMITGATLTVNPTSTTTYSVLGTDGVCSNTTTATINVTSLSTTVSSSSTYYCIGSPTVSLTGSGATNYTWSPSAGLSSTSGAVVNATPTITTTYTMVGEINGCTDTKTVTINVPPISSLTAVTSNSVICAGSTSPSLSSTGATTYTWMPGSMSGGTITVSPTATTDYTVYGQTAQGCIAFPAVVTVSVLPAVVPQITASNSQACVSQTISLAVTPVSGNTYTWQPSTQINGATNTSSVIASPNASTNVIYTVTASNGVCTGSDTILINVLTPPSNTSFTAINNNTICVGGCVTFSATTSGTQPISFNWYYESGIGTSSVGIHPEACYPSAGTFSVMAVAYNACGSDTVVNSNFVNVYDYPLPLSSNDTTINIGDNATIWSSGGLTYQWSPNNGTIACATCSTTVVNPTVTTQYVVTVSNSPYCKVQDTVNVIVDVNCGDFFVPNVFSPNDDGLNDFINVHGRCIQSFVLQIFNRWGEKVFETSSLSESWDGTWRGKKLDTGVFVYKAEGTSIDGQTFKFKGNITLLR